MHIEYYSSVKCMYKVHTKSIRKGGKNKDFCTKLMKFLIFQLL